MNQSVTHACLTLPSLTQDFATLADSASDLCYLIGAEGLSSRKTAAQVAATSTLLAIPRPPLAALPRSHPAPVVCALYAHRLLLILVLQRLLAECLDHDADPATLADLLTRTERALCQ